MIMRKRSAISFLVLSFLLLSRLAFAQNDDDMLLIKTRVLELLRATSHNEDQIKQIMEQQNPDGSWPGIDYADDNRASWEPANHWRTYMNPLARFYNNCSRPDLRQQLKESIISGLGFWYNTNPRCPNWWWNQIGVPTDLGEVLLLSEELLSDELIIRGVELMYGIEGDTVYYIGGRNLATGMNLNWFANIHLMGSLLLRDSDGIRTAFKKAGSEIRLSQGEGIKHDFSFHQHGPLLYSGGYGRGFTASTAKFIYLASGTGFAYDPEKVDIFSAYLLEGQRWMVYNGLMDLAATGREMTRNHGSSVAAIAQGAEFLSEIGCPRGPEIDLFAESITMKGSNGGFSGNRQFWLSDFMVHRRPNCYFSVKMASDRVKPNETVNDENLQGYYEGRGITYIKRRGDEYEGIIPVWDWGQLPGLLAPQRSAPPPRVPQGKDAMGTTAFVGGVSNGDMGMAAYDFNWDGVKARRAWFFYEAGMVCLVAGIRIETDVPIIQNINQCVGNGDVFYRQNSTVKRFISDERERISEVEMVWHDSITYYFPESATIYVFKKSVSKNWRDISHSYDSLVTKTVFNLCMDPGKSRDSTSLAYAVLPNTTINMDLNTENVGFEILENDEKIQAVWFSDEQVVEAAFYTPGKLSLPGSDYAVEMKSSGLLMITQREGYLDVAVSNPENIFKSFPVNLLKDDELIKTITIMSPDVPYGGQSVTGRLSFVE